MSITRNQWFGIIGVILSALMTSTAFLTDTFGSNIAHYVIGSAGFVNMIMNGIVVIITGQAGQVRDVAAMPGVDRISINAQANTTLASAAIDPEQPKIRASTPEVRDFVNNTVKG